MSVRWMSPTGRGLRVKSRGARRERHRDTPHRVRLLRKTPPWSGAVRFDHRLDHAKQMGHTMKTTIIRAVAALSLAAAALLTPTAANAYTDPSAVSVTPSTVAPNGTATFTTDRPIFDGDEDVAISVTGVAAKGITLASIASETNDSLRTKAVGGNLRTPVHFPANAKGVYTLTFTGARSGIVLHSSVTITPVGAPSAPAQGGLAVTGFDAGSTTGLWLTGAAFLVGGSAVGIGAVVRRRRTSHD